jgi:hypothetical protein
MAWDRQKHKNTQFNPQIKKHKIPNASWEKQKHIYLIPIPMQNANPYINSIQLAFGKSECKII